jgi:hypothetical protein
MSTQQNAPERTPAAPPRAYTPITVDDPTLREIERRMAEQDEALREVMAALAPIGRGLVPNPHAELKELEELCTATVTQPATPYIHPHATRC